MPREDSERSYYRAGYYDPVTGRFVSEDSFKEVLRGMNFYEYVRNDPARLIDPDGLSPINWGKIFNRGICGDSGEGNRDSELIVISIPELSDQSSERSDAGRRILQKVITIVKGKVWSPP
jgi:RHS repeat-associated protein